MSNGESTREAVMVQSVDRAASILEMLAQNGWSGGSEVARELGVHRSTALRLLGTLERNGLVERDARTAKYRLGARLQQLARLVTGEFDLRGQARPICEQLAATLGETVTLDVLDAEEILPIEQATGSSSVVNVSRLGRRTPIHCTASGKVILAFGPETLRHRVLSQPLEQRTAHTIVDPAVLKAQLASIREIGYGFTSEELEIGLSAIAGPVRSADGRVVAALEVSGPAHRLSPTEPVALVDLTCAAAADLSRRLGYRRPQGTPIRSELTPDL
jgi:DNA-binding IclR family transcriptional regulator